jgi:hypothetical protein
MRSRKYRSLYLTFSASIFALLICATSAAQLTTAKPPNPNITAPGPHAPPQAHGLHPPNHAGDVEGFVYWDVNTVTHKQAGTCSGLAVVVSAAGSSNHTIQIGNNFKYAGQIKAFLYGGKQAVYDVCIYAYHGQPVGPPLQAQLMITQPNQFSPNVAPQVATISPITIINAQCNMLPAIVPSTVGDLTSHWGSCQDRAYNVNFALAPSAHLMNSGTGSGGMLLGAANSGPTQSQGGMSPTPQQSGSRGMVPRTKDPGPINAPSRGKGTSGQLLPAKPGTSKLTNGNVTGQEQQ